MTDPEPGDREEIFMQEARWPKPLTTLVERLRYKADWLFELKNHLDRGQDSVGLTLVITITTPDSYHPERTRTVLHYFPVPPAAYDRRSWQRWLFDQILLVERHEAMEFFATLIGVSTDGKRHEITNRPYAPSHGPGNDPYLIRELGTEQDVRTSFRGVVS